MSAETPLDNFTIVTDSDQQLGFRSIVPAETLHVDETVVAWLRGGYEAHGVLAGHVTLAAVAPTAADRLLAGECECGARVSRFTDDDAALDQCASRAGASIRPSVRTSSGRAGDSSTMRAKRRAALRPRPRHQLQRCG